MEDEDILIRPIKLGQIKHLLHGNVRIIDSFGNTIKLKDNEHNYIKSIYVDLIPNPTIIISCYSDAEAS